MGLEDEIQSTKSKISLNSLFSCFLLPSARIIWQAMIPGQSLLLNMLRLQCLLVLEVGSLNMPLMDSSGCVETGPEIQLGK